MIRRRIGLNLSPLMAKYVTDGNVDAWIRKAASIISGVANKTGMQVYNPHVTIPTSNDHAFMQQALSLIDKRDNIVINRTNI